MDEQIVSENPDIFTADGFVETIIEMPVLGIIPHVMTPVEMPGFTSISENPVDENISTELVIMRPKIFTGYDSNTGEIKFVLTIPENEIIHYEEPGISIIEGYSVIREQKVDIQTGQIVDADLSVEKLMELQRMTIQKIKDLFDLEMNVITSQYPQAERESFSLQEDEARNFINDANTVTTIIDSILLNLPGVDKTFYANSILQKSIAFKSLVGACIGKRKARQIQYEAVKNNYEQLQIFLGEL